MKLMVMYLAVIYAVLAMASGQVFRRLCPHVTTMANFSASRYAGTWYQDKKFTSVFELGRTCNKGNYVDLGNGKIQITNMGTTPWGSKTYVTGIAIPADLAEPARLTVDFNLGSGPGNYLVLDTDYENYAVVYSCKTYIGLFNGEFAWILRRNKGLQLQGSLQTAINLKLLSNDIDPGRLTDVFDPSC